jgi:hypothetical protein
MIANPQKRFSEREIYALLPKRGSANSGQLSFSCHFHSLFYKMKTIRAQSFSQYGNEADIDYLKEEACRRERRHIYEE